MQFIKPGINIDFIGRRKIAFILSLAMILITIVSLLFHGGPRLGVDFAGGTVIQVKFDSAVSIADVKSALKSIDIGTSSVQEFGAAKENEYLIRADSSATITEDISLNIEQALQQATGHQARNPACRHGRPAGRPGFERKGAAGHVLCPSFHHHLHFRAF